jgi:hypothetical protein
MTCPGCGLDRHTTSCIDALRARIAELEEALVDERERNALLQRDARAALAQGDAVWGETLATYTGDK